MKSDEKKELCIALSNISAYHDSILGTRFKFLKGELATKEKVFGMIPEMTEEEYAELFRPATEEEINGEFDWDGYQYILKKETKCMKARIKGTDVVISVQPIYSVDGLRIESFINVTNGDLFPPHTIDIIPNDTDWEALRNQAAIAAMQEVMNFFGSIDYNQETIARLAVEQADTLIEELKKK